ncbi:hypothetical protein HDU98_005796, partial [Podochytrium sp. JEL0797]
MALPTTNITLAFLSNYCSIQSTAMSGSQLLNFSQTYNPALIHPYQLSSYIFFPDLAMQMAVDAINANPSILPGINVNVKRFSDCGAFYPGVENDYAGYSGGYATARSVSDVLTNQDVIGVIGNEFSSTARISAAALSVYNIPYCSMASNSPRLSDKNKFPFFWRILPSAGLGNHIHQMLRLWNIRRVAIISQIDDDM